MPGKITKRIPFTDDDDKLLVKYLAKYNRDGKNRRGKRLWDDLVANAEGRWPWAKRHSSQSWREHYKKDHIRFDMLITKRVQQRYPDRDEDPPRPPPPPPEAGPSKTQGRRPRQEFTREEELNLVKYLAIENPGNIDRMGNTVYKNLVQDAEGLWPWSSRHTWHSWREKYKKRSEEFDEMILNYQKRFKILPSKDVDTSLWDKLPRHVREEDVEPPENHLVDSDGVEEVEDEDPLQDLGDDAEDELVQDDDALSSAEVSQLLKPEIDAGEEVDEGQHEEGEEEESRQPRHGLRPRKGSRQTSRSLTPPRVTQSSKARGKRRQRSETTDEEPDEVVEKKVAPTRSTATRKQRALKKVIADDAQHRETSSAPVPAAKKRKLVRRTASEAERLVERPAKRRRVVATAVVVSDSEG